MSDLLGTAWALPVGGLVFAVVALTAIFIASRRFDRKYGKDQ